MATHLWRRPRGSKIFKSFFGFIFSNPHVVMANLSISKSGFETIEKLLVEKKLEVLISRKYPLRSAAEAYATLKSGGIPGKILFNVIYSHSLLFRGNLLAALRLVSIAAAV